MAAATAIAVPAQLLAVLWPSAESGMALSLSDFVTNSALPGAALILRGRYGWGLLFLLPALIALAVFIVGLAVVDGSFQAQWCGVGAGLYVACALVADLCLYVAYRQRPLDEAATRAAFDAYAQAVFADDQTLALQHAHSLCAAAPQLPAAWSLLATAAAAADQGGLQRRASKRARLLHDAQ